MAVIIMPFLINKFNYFSSICRRVGGRGKKRVFFPIYFVFTVVPETSQTLPPTDFPFAHLVPALDKMTIAV